MTIRHDRFTDFIPGIVFQVEPKIIQRDGYTEMQWGECRIYRPDTISTEEMQRRIDNEPPRPPRDEP